MNHLPISVQEQPSDVDFLTKKLHSVDTNAKLVIKDKNCQYEPPTLISVQEQPSEVDYLNKKLHFVDTNAKLVMIERTASMNHQPQYQFKNSLLMLPI